MGNHSSIKAQLYGIDISFTLLAALAVGLRVIVRSRSAGNYGWDDHLCVISLVLTFANFTLNAISESWSCE